MREVARSRAAEEVVLVVLALEDRLEVATRVLEDVLEVKLSVSPRSAMVSELSIVLAPAPTSDPSKTSSNIPDIGKEDNSGRRKGSRDDRDGKSDVNVINGKRRHDQQPWHTCIASHLVDALIIRQTHLEGSKIKDVFQQTETSSKDDQRWYDMRGRC